MQRNSKAPSFFEGVWLFIMLSLCAAPAFAQEAMDCLTCHADSGLVATDSTGATRSLFVDAAHLESSIHAGFDCVTCHADIKEIPHPEKLAPAACATCHEDAVAEVAQSVHGPNAATGLVPVDAPSCGDCHGSHDIRATSDSVSWVNPRQLAFTCGRCHANPEIVQRHQIPVKDPMKAYLRSVHGRFALAGRDSVATCGSCHGNHKIYAANNPESKAFYRNIPQTCGACHSKITAEFEQSVHGLAIARGSRDAPVCTDCHSEHGIQLPSEGKAATSPQNMAVETCGRCHASTRITEKYGMRSGRLSTFSDSFHGLALRSGQLAAANCGSCHGVHGILPSSDPRSMVSKENLPITCGNCHPNAGVNFAKGPVHLTKEESEGRIVSVVRNLYIGLIVLVIGGMIVHNGLDFIRKSKHVLRHRRVQKDFEI